MDRRDFMRSIGLGGLALTLPKPLEILAAKASDLAAPPLHVGYVQIPGGIALVEIGVSVNREENPGLDLAALFQNSWQIHVVSRPLRAGSYLTLFEGCFAGTCFIDGSLVTQDRHVAYNVPEDHCAEMWIVPEGKPQRMLPKLHATFKALSINRLYANPHKGSVPIKTVRLERTRALEMGLVTPADPYETF